MVDDRRQVSFRLSAYYRGRMKEVVAEHNPDIHNESDLMQDALWLWFHEYDLMRSKNGVAKPDRNPAGAARDQVDAGAARKSEEVPGVEVGDPSEPGQSGTRIDGPDLGT
jgi:hypothetical protein